jgi:hypothetical protein
MLMTFGADDGGKMGKRHFVVKHDGRRDALWWWWCTTAVCILEEGEE